jgi:hypothetical protein
MSAFSRHSVFVLDPDGKPLTPTTPAKARKLLRGGVAKKVRSQLGTFGIQQTLPFGFADSPGFRDRPAFCGL